MTILEVGCEGGSLTLSGEKNSSGAWSFRLDRDETAAYEALSDEDRGGTPPTVARGSRKSVYSLTAALGLLDRYPWFQLIPLEVHPEFREAILLEVRERGTAEDEVKWNDHLRSYQAATAMESTADNVQRNCRAGMLVEMHGKPEWGPGKIVHIDGDKLHIIFRDREGETARIFRMDHPGLRRALIQNDPVLDNLPPLKQTEHRWKLPRARMSLERAKGKFLHLFPGGFSDPRYLSEERGYKMVAHERFQQELGLAQAKEMLANDDVASVIRRGSSILNSLRLIAPFENFAFNHAMLDENAARAFYAALFQLLDASEISEAVFEPYAQAVMFFTGLASASRKLAGRNSVTLHRAAEEVHVIET